MRTNSFSQSANFLLLASCLYDRLIYLTQSYALKVYCLDNTFQQISESCSSGGLRNIQSSFPCLVWSQIPLSLCAVSRPPFRFTQQHAPKQTSFAGSSLLNQSSSLFPVKLTNPISKSFLSGPLAGNTSSSPNTTLIRSVLAPLSFSESNSFRCAAVPFPKSISSDSPLQFLSFCHSRLPFQKSISEGSVRQQLTKVTRKGVGCFCWYRISA